MTERVRVRFVRPYAAYASGERAGFPPAKAERLVEMRVAALDAPPVDRQVERPPVTKSPPGPPAKRRSKKG